jgi:ubiquinone biosynthesis protein
MSLYIRLLRALWLFGIIFVSYMLQLGLARLLGRWEHDPVSGREVRRLPGWLHARRERVDSRNAKRLLRGMLRLRGVYIKLGQVLSIMGGFLPRAFTSELETLQDQVPPRPFSDVQRAFQENFQQAPEACFKSIETEPVAAASLGQVHVAYLKSGEKVAVKILYPKIREIIQVDLRVLGLVMRVYNYFFPFKGLKRVHESLVDLLRRETDYIHEAQCMEKMAANFKTEEDILFPSVVHELTTKDILTMSFMEGIKITKTESFEKLGIDRTQVATRLIQSFYKQLFVDRFFHADPHPGNFLVQAGETPDKPKLVVLDFGAISEVREELVDGALEILQALMTSNGELVLKGFRKMGFVSEEGNKELLEQTVMSYFRKLLKIKDRTAGALMRSSPKELEKLANPDVQRKELRELMKSFEYPEGWFYVERASVLMFWLAAQIDADLDTMMVGVPYVMPLIMSKQMAQMATSSPETTELTSPEPSETPAVASSVN